MFNHATRIKELKFGFHESSTLLNLGLLYSSFFLEVRRVAWDVFLCRRIFFSVAIVVVIVAVATSRRRLPAKYVLPGEMLINKISTKEAHDGNIKGEKRPVLITPQKLRKLVTTTNWWLKSRFQGRRKDGVMFFSLPILGIRLAENILRWALKSDSIENGLEEKSPVNVTVRSHRSHAESNQRTFASYKDISCKQSSPRMTSSHLGSFPQWRKES